MTTHAYSQLYLSKASRTLGHMLHAAVEVYHVDGADFLNRFVRCGLAEEFGNGNAKYVAGMSGQELFYEVMYLTTGEYPEMKVIRDFDRSPSYWIGWILARYKWWSARSFHDILNAIPYDSLRALYVTLHEADVQKAYEVFEMHFEKEQLI